LLGFVATLLAVRRTLTQVFVVFSLIAAIGGHWTVLQSVAWVNMAITYSQDAPLVEALQKTFSGDSPCQMCKAVREGQQSEREQGVLKSETKLDFWLADGGFVLLNPHAPASVAKLEPVGSLRPDRPPSPPPRPA
jgi:hypothetical protein